MLIRRLPPFLKHRSSRLVKSREPARAPRDAESAFVALGRVDLDQILCYEEERRVGKDNTVILDRMVLQLNKQPGPRSCAGLRVLVRLHLEGTYSVWLGTRCLGRYDTRGKALKPVESKAGEAVA